MREDNRRLIFRAAIARGAVFRTKEHVAVLDRAIDAAMAGEALSVHPTQPPVHVPLDPPPAQASGAWDPVSAIDADLLRISCPENSRDALAEWVEPVQKACRRWGIDTIREVASFLANIGVESAGLTRLEENLNYSAKRMAQVWPGRFAVNPSAPMRSRIPNALAKSLANNPEKLANHVYANRMGNGPPESGDGWRHRGYGPKQLTGKRNHAAYALDAGIPLAGVPAHLRTKEGGMDSAGWFWKENNLDKFAATPGIADDRQAINGGQTGVELVGPRFDALIDELLKREKMT